MSLNKAPFRRVLHRPQLFMGGEREPTMFAAIVAGALVIAGQNLVALVTGLVLWSVLIGIFRQMAKTDPKMTSVYRRYIRYRVYYGARSRPAIGDTMSPTRQWAILLSGAAACVLLLYAAA